MWKLSLLCVLLPLAASLDTCDDAKVAAFQAKTKLQGNLLENFANRKFWFVASGAVGSNANHQSAEVQYSSISGNSASATFTFRDSNGAVVSTDTNVHTLEGDHIVVKDKSISIYFFQCSQNLIGGYRCQSEDGTGTGPNYYIWAAWDKSDADVKGEIEACKAEFTKIDAAAAFVDRVHP